MLSAGDGSGGVALAGYPVRVAHSRDAGHAQFGERQPLHSHETAPVGSYAIPADYDYRDGPMYARYSHAGYGGRVASPSGTGSDHSTYVVSQHAGPTHRARAPSGTYTDYSGPYTNATDAQGTRIWPRGAPGPSPKIGADLSTFSAGTGVAGAQADTQKEMKQTLTSLAATSYAMAGQRKPR